MPPARDADGAAYRPHKSKNHFKCIIPGCPSTTTTNIAKLHSFPWRDMPRAEKWMSAVGRGDLVGAPAKALLRLRVCDLHFERSLRRGKNLKLFDSTAVPTLRLSTASAAPTLRPSTAPAAPTLRPSTAPAAPTSAAPPVNGTHTPIRVPKELARFLSLRETLARSNTARVGFDRAFCRRALRLRHAAPRAYDVLWRALRLPPPARLARLPLPLGSRLHPLVLAALSARLGRLPASHRHAALCLDEVTLSGGGGAFYYCDSDRLVGLHEVEGRLRARRAASALLVAVRGERWTQPLVYWLLEADADARELAAALRRLLTALQEAGVRVRLVLSALGPTFAKLARALRATPERPYVLHARLGRLPFLHDPDQLLMTLRDTLRAYDVLLRAEDGTELRARWAHVEELREEDRRSGGPRLLPELTRARVAPDAAEAARPHHALAVLSARVGAALAGKGDARRGTARLVTLAGELAESLRCLRADGGASARLRRRADAATAALGEMRVASWAGEEHAAEEFSRALRLTLEGALLAAAQCSEPLPLARCGLRPLRRWAERVEGLSPKDFRARFRRWGARHLARAAPRAGRDDLQALLEAAECEPLSEEPEQESARVSPGALQHAVPLRGGVRRAQAALLREMRRAHGCAAWTRWSADSRRWHALLADMDLRFRRVWSGRVDAAGVCARIAHAVAGALQPAARMPCACFPRDTLCRLYARFRLRAALRHHNAPARTHLAPWAFA